MNRKHMLLSILFWSLVGSVVLRLGFTDDMEYFGACLLYSIGLGFVVATIELGNHNE